MHTLIETHTGGLHLTGWPTRVGLIVVVVVGAICWLLSLHLSLVAYGMMALIGCPTGSCARFVIASGWARWFGVPVSVLAITVYSVILASIPFVRSRYTLRRRAAWSILVILAVMIAGAAAWFIGLMVLHLRKSCGHCISIHIMGMFVAYIIISLAPTSSHGEALLSSKRMLTLTALGLIGVLMLAGGQVALSKSYTDNAGGNSVDGNVEPPSSEYNITPDVPAFEEGISEAPADCNTTVGKMSLVAQLKDAYGLEWDRPTSTCHFIPYYASRTDVRKTNSGLYYEVLRQGTGATPRPQDSVRLHLRGTLWTGEVFQDTYAEALPLECRVDQLVPGLVQGLGMMSEGSHWRMLLLPALAYGFDGIAGVVPPNALVLYEVELLGVLPGLTAGDSKPVATQSIYRAHDAL